MIEHRLHIPDAAGDGQHLPGHDRTGRGPIAGAVAAAPELSSQPCSQSLSAVPLAMCAAYLDPGPGSSRRAYHMPFLQ